MNVGDDQRVVAGGFLGDAAIVAIDCDHQQDEAGMSSAVTHAPSTNLVTSTTMVVTPVANAPRPLTNMRTVSAALGALPVHDHAGLGQREGQERADGVEGDQAVGDAAEDDEQQRGERDQDVNAPGVEQAAAAEQKDVRADNRRGRWRG